MCGTREKLIELLNAVDDVCPKDASCYDCEYKDVTHCAIPAKADYLIANGVTVQKWIPVTERLPEDELPKETKRVQIKCVVFTDKGSVKICVRQRYRTKRNSVWGYTAWEWSKADFAKPTHWMPLPSTEGLE